VEQPGGDGSLEGKRNILVQKKTARTVQLFVPGGQ